MNCEDVELEKLLNQIMGIPEEFLENFKATRETNNNVIVAESDSYSTGVRVSEVSLASLNLTSKSDQLIHHMEGERLEALGFSESSVSPDVSLADCFGDVSFDTSSSDIQTNFLRHDKINALTRTTHFVDHVVHSLGRNDEESAAFLIPGRFAKDMKSSKVVVPDTIPCSFSSEFTSSQSFCTNKNNLLMQSNVMGDRGFSHGRYDAMSGGKIATFLDVGSHVLRDFSTSSLCNKDCEGLKHGSNSYSNGGQVLRDGSTGFLNYKDPRGPIHRSNSSSNGGLNNHSHLNLLLGRGLNIDEMSLCSHDSKMKKSPGYLLNSYLYGGETKCNISFFPKNSSHPNPSIPSYLHYEMQMTHSIREEERQKRMQQFVIHNNQSLESMKNHVTGPRNPHFSSCYDDDGGNIYSPYASSADWGFQVLQHDTAFCCRSDKFVSHARNLCSSANQNGICSIENDCPHSHSQLRDSAGNLALGRFLCSRSSLCQDQKQSSFPLSISRKSNKVISASIPSMSLDCNSVLMNGSLKVLPKPNLRRNLMVKMPESEDLNADTLEVNLKMVKDAFEPEMPYKSLAEIEGRIFSIAKDQYGCRFLQKKFDEGDKEDVEKIFSEIIDHAVELMMDAFGNYLIQKILEVCNEDQRLDILKSLTSKEELINVSLNLHGTRAVQKLIETIKSSNQISVVTEALRPGVIILIKDLNGNHVIQRCLQHLSNQDNQFIFEAAAYNCVDIATHRHGCCVLQRCIDYSSGTSRQHLISEIAANSLLLSEDPFGNYVVQYVLELDSSWASNQVMGHLSGNYSRLSRQKFSSNVVEKCLKLSNDEWIARIVQELIDNSCLPNLLQDPFANYVIQSALTVSKGDVHTHLVEAIRPHMPSLRSSPYGKRILSRRNLRKR